MSIYEVRHEDSGGVFEYSKYVEATDVDEAIAIFEEVHPDYKLISASEVPSDWSPTRSTRITTRDQALPSLLGGVYTLQYTALGESVDLASSRVGKFWSEMYQRAVEEYGADHISYRFEMDYTPGSITE
jgi:hypothetical protein